MNKKSGTAGTPVNPIAPIAALEADEADPGTVSKIKADQRQTKSGKYGSTKAKPYTPPTGQSSAANGSATEEEEKKTTWIEIELVGDDDQPVPGEKYKITLPDGRVDEGTLDQNGWVRVAGFEKGTCKVTFPELDQEAWEYLSSTGPKPGKT